ncbi:MAG: metal-sensitive transcriptional regulator [bacterium]|nr:metal-sensitive transcriptional regulator [bacterium]
MKKNLKDKAMRRLRIVEGQVRGLRSMVEKEQYCVDIVTQSFAVKQALSGVEDLILENHLSTHVVEQMRSGKEIKAIKEILEIQKLSRKSRG